MKYNVVANDQPIELLHDCSIWMNIHEVINCVQSWDGGDEPTTYSYAISKGTVAKCNIDIHDTQLYPTLRPFLLFEDVYWQLEDAS